MRRHLVTALNALAVFAALAGLWQALVWISGVPKYVLPGPMDVAKAIGERHAPLIESLLISTTSAAGGLVLSIFAGVGIALVFAQWPWLRRTLYPYTILLQTVPIIAITPLIILWMGSGAWPVAVVTFIICLAPIIANTTQGLISVDENLIHLFLMHKASQAQILFKLRLPHAMPSMFAGIRISAGIAVIGAITGEWFAGSNRVGQGGLGYSIMYASSQLQTAYLFALVIAATVLGFSFFFIVMFVEWYFLHHWHESARTAETE
jgi:NitT/TauT family transport system permease protein